MKPEILHRVRREASSYAAENSGDLLMNFERSTLDQRDAVKSALRAAFLAGADEAATELHLEQEPAR